MSSFLSMTEARLPPGFRFHPRDEELVCDYLEKKAAAGNNGGSHACPMMIDVDLNKCEPWELPEMACVGGKEWYFFNLRDRKYATGQRTNRATQSGYWKATGKDRQVRRKGVLVGMRKTLVFYRGRAPKGKKTDWVMHEYRMEATHPSTFPPLQEDWALCRVFYKSRPTVTSQQTMQTSYDDTNSSSLPPLMDTFFAFDQAASSSLEGNQQVPCFSDLPPTLVSPRDLAAPPISLVERSHADGLPNSGSCDEKVLKLVLNHFKLEGISDKQFPPNLPQGSLEGYLTDNGLSHIWNSF